MNFKPSERPTMAQIANKLSTMIRDSENEFQKVNMAQVEKLFDLEKQIQKKLLRVWHKCDPFYTEDMI